MLAGFALAAPENVMAKSPSKIRQALKDIPVAGALIWLTGACGLGLWRNMERGWIRNRRGPDIDVSENPLVFWALNGFFGLGTILVGGLAALCIWIAVTNLTRK